MSSKKPEPSSSVNVFLLLLQQSLLSGAQSLSAQSRGMACGTYEQVGGWGGQRKAGGTNRPGPGSESEVTQKKNQHDTNTKFRP